MINSSLNQLQKCFNINKLILNVTKTKDMILTTTYKYTTIFLDCSFDYNDGQQSVFQ